jgi:hypothetical protein
MFLQNLAWSGYSSETSGLANRVNRMLNISDAPLPSGRRVLRRNGGIEMWQEIMHVSGRKEMMRYFVGDPNARVESFDRAHNAWDHFRELTGTANTPPDMPASLPVNFLDRKVPASAQKMRRRPRS